MTRRFLRMLWHAGDFTKEEYKELKEKDTKQIAGIIKEDLAKKGLTYDIANLTKYNGGSWSIVMNYPAKYVFFDGACYVEPFKDISEFKKWTRQKRKWRNSFLLYRSISGVLPEKACTAGLSEPLLQFRLFLKDLLLLRIPFVIYES